MPGSEAAADFVIAVYREDGAWQVATMPPHAADSLGALVAALRQQPGEGGAIGFVSVEEDFFIAVRVRGTETRILVSDASAAAGSRLGSAVLAHIHEGAAEGSPPPPPADGDAEPVGDLDIFADLGMDMMELEALCDDPELYPDEMLYRVAGRLGFADSFAQALDSALG